MIERTSDLFEKIEGYQQAQPLTREAFDYNIELEKMSFSHRLIFKLFFRLSGFKTFNKGWATNL